MKTNQAGIDLIKQFEGCKLQSYLCPAGVPTIGYGSTNGVTMGMTITEEEAESLLRVDLEKFEKQLNSLNLKINENQFSALVSFIYNLGFGSFLTSTLRRRIMTNPNEPSIRDEFNKWVRGGGKVLPGLVKRRAAESELYFKPL